jgi:hypothetical protein
VGVRRDPAIFFDKCTANATYFLFGLLGDLFGLLLLDVRLRFFLPDAACGVSDARFTDFFLDERTANATGCFVCAPLFLCDCCMVRASPGLVFNSESRFS